MSNETRVHIRTSKDEEDQRNLKEFPVSEHDGYQTLAEPMELTSIDSAAFAKSILNAKEPNELLKALFSKDNEEILRALLAKKQSSTK